jgi:hypothetical protein
MESIETPGTVLKNSKNLFHFGGEFWNCDIGTLGIKNKFSSRMTRSVGAER